MFWFHRGIRFKDGHRGGLRSARLTSFPVARRGAAVLSLSALCFGLLGGLIQHLSHSLPTPTLVFFRNFLGFLFLLPLVGRLGFRRLATRRWKDHLIRSLAGLGSMALSFYSLARMPLADAMTLGYTAPLFMPLIARWRLGEGVPRYGGRLMGLGFLGVWLILKPGQGVFRWVALAALGSGFLAAVAQVGIRGLTQTEPSVRIVFYFGLIATAVSAVPFVAGHSWPSAAFWPGLLLMGGLATLAQLLLTAGYRRLMPTRGGPLMYIAVAVAALLDWGVKGHRPDLWTLAGMGIIVGAGVFIFRFSETPRAETAS